MPIEEYKQKIVKTLHARAGLVSLTFSLTKMARIRRFCRHLSLLKTMSVWWCILRAQLKFHKVNLSSQSPAIWTTILLYVMMTLHSRNQVLSLRKTYVFSIWLVTQYILQDSFFFHLLMEEIPPKHVNSLFYLNFMAILTIDKLFATSLLLVFEN